ncbi:hypothetical protein DL770_001152 [Monosporascus sp. CRB-9-2]|nr:hypothetical protein DL770_001152 [Monosporascus sp. CRB-9-2]
MAAEPSHVERSMTGGRGRHVDEAPELHSWEETKETSDNNSRSPRAAPEASATTLPTLPLELQLMILERMDLAALLSCGARGRRRRQPGRRGAAPHMLRRVPVRAAGAALPRAGPGGPVQGQLVLAVPPVLAVAADACLRARARRGGGAARHDLFYNARLLTCALRWYLLGVSNFCLGITALATALRLEGDEGSLAVRVLVTASLSVPPQGPYRELFFSSVLFSTLFDLVGWMTHEADSEPLIVVQINYALLYVTWAATFFVSTTKRKPKRL